MADDWLNGIQIGANVANQALDRNLRLQQLRSEQAHQQFLERQSAMHTQMLLEESNRKANEFKSKIEGEADAQKALVDYNLMRFPGDAAPEGVLPSVRQTMNEQYGMDEDSAAWKAFSPVAAKHGGVQGVEALRTNIATGRFRQAEAIRQQALAAQESARASGQPALDAAKANKLATGSALDQARIDAIKNGSTKAFAPPELERIFQAAADEGNPYSPEDKKMARDVHMGIQARERAAVPPITEEDYVAKNLSGLLKDKPTKKITTPGKVFGTNTQEVPLTVQESIDLLRDRYRTIFGGKVSQDSSGDSTDSTEPNSSGSNEEPRVMKDGRTAIFDSNTKKFIRYAQ